jgi:hypothetical protein
MTSSNFSSRFSSKTILKDWLIQKLSSIIHLRCKQNLYIIMPSKHIYESYGSRITGKDSQHSFVGHRGSSTSSELREPQNDVHSRRYTPRNRQSSNLNPSEELDKLIEQTINQPYKYVPFGRYKSPSELRKYVNSSKKSVVGCSYPNNTSNHRRLFTSPSQYSHVSNDVSDSSFRDETPNRGRNFERSSNVVSKRQEHRNHIPYSTVDKEKTGAHTYESSSKYDRNIHDEYFDDDTQYPLSQGDNNLTHHYRNRKQTHKSLQVTEDHESNYQYNDYKYSNEEYTKHRSAYPDKGLSDYGSSDRSKTASENNSITRNDRLFDRMNTSPSPKASQTSNSNYSPSHSRGKEFALSRRPSTLSKFRNPSNISEITGDSRASALPDDRVFLLSKMQPKSEVSLAATAAAHLLSSDKSNLYDFDSAVRSVSDLLVNNTSSRSFSQRIKAFALEESEENESYFPVSYLKMQESVRRDIIDSSIGNKKRKSFHMSAYQFWAELTLLILLELLKVYPKNPEVTHMVADAVMINGVSTIQNDWLKSGEDDITWVASQVAERILSSTTGSEKIAFTVIVTLFKEGTKIIQKERVLKQIEDSSFQEKIRYSIQFDDQIKKRTALIIQNARVNISRKNSNAESASRNTGSSSQGSKSLTGSESRAEKLRRVRAEKVEKSKAYLAKISAQEKATKSSVEDNNGSVHDNSSRGVESLTNSESSAEKLRRMRAEKVEKSKAYLAKINAEMNLANNASVASTDRSPEDANSQEAKSSSKIPYKADADDRLKNSLEQKRTARAETVRKSKEYIAMKSAQTDIKECAVKPGIKDSEDEVQASSNLSGRSLSHSIPARDAFEVDSTESSKSSRNGDKIKIDGLSRSSSNRNKSYSFPDDKSQNNRENVNVSSDDKSSSSSVDDTKSQIADQIIRIQMRAAQNNDDTLQNDIRRITPKQMELENGHINKVSHLKEVNQVTGGTDLWPSWIFETCCGRSNDEDDRQDKMKRGLTRQNAQTNHFNLAPNQHGGIYNGTWSSDYSSSPSSVDYARRATLDATPLNPGDANTYDLIEGKASI